MKSIKDEDILSLVNQINENNNEFLKDYLDKFFNEYTEINYLEDMKLTHQEHMRIENAITHLVKLTTITSVQTTLKILEELEIINTTTTR